MIRAPSSAWRCMSDHSSLVELRRLEEDRVGDRRACRCRGRAPRGRAGRARPARGPARGRSPGRAAGRGGSDRPCRRRARPPSPRGSPSRPSSAPCSSRFACSSETFWSVDRLAPPRAASSSTLRVAEVGGHRLAHEEERQDEDREAEEADGVVGERDRRRRPRRRRRSAAGATRTAPSRRGASVSWPSSAMAPESRPVLTTK